MLESPEDRFQHDIEELESGGGWKGVVRALVIVLLAAGGVGALYFMAGKKPPPPRLNVKGLVIIETLEPAKEKLAAAPTRFRWESIAGRNDYLFRLLQKGNPVPVVERPARENSTELTAEEAARLAPGSSYIWEVVARAKDGKPLGSGRGFFDL